MEDSDELPKSRSDSPGWWDWEGGGEGEAFFAKGSPANASEMLSCYPQKDEVAEIALTFEPGDPVPFDVLRAFVNLVTLQINHCPAVMLEEILKHIPQVKTLGLNGCPDMKDLKAFHYLSKRLEALQLCNCSRVETLEGIEALIGLKQIGVMYGNDCLKDISQLKSLRSIRSIFLAGCKNTLDLSFLKAMPSVEKISVNRCEMPLDLSIIEAMPSVKWISIDHCEWLKDVTFLFRMPNMESISLRESWNIPMRQFAQLRLQHPKCSITFPWQNSKLNDWYPIAIELITLFLNRLPIRHP